MTKAMQALTVAILCTMIGGAFGGFVGRVVGQVSPSFVRVLAENGPKSSLPQGFDAAEFGLGLGIVSGLFFGAGTGLFVVLMQAIRDALLSRAALAKQFAGSMREV